MAAHERMMRLHDGTADRSPFPGFGIDRSQPSLALTDPAVGGPGRRRSSEAAT
ncbi:hypothetical protein MICRO80W_190034 [Micrococcus luteus]|nr:hypothetical protein MICRO116_380007 [Micrococcus sp. 116]VWX49431.1 hypothetical protein MICRO80W_190034 [Micrococcus luteus]VXB31777.1 hypothetical protein MICRO11B_220028 [Micrococcus luteus]